MKAVANTRKILTVQYKSLPKLIKRFVGIDPLDRIVSIWLGLFITETKFYAQKEITCQTDQYLVILFSKTYVFEDNLTKC